MNPKSDFDFIEAVAALATAGFSALEIAKQLGMPFREFKQRRKDSLLVRKALSNGREMTTKYLILRGLEAATGYDYTETTEENRDGKILKRSVTRHRSPDAVLLPFMIINLTDGKFKNTRYLTPVRGSVPEIKGQESLEAEKIRKLSGKLGEIANRNVKRDAEAVSRTDTQNEDGESGIQAETPQLSIEGQEGAGGI